MFKKIIITFVISTSFILIFLGLFFLKSSKNNDNEIIYKELTEGYSNYESQYYEDCNKYTKIIAKEKKFKDIKNFCNVKYFKSENEIISLVEISYGEKQCWMDCHYDGYIGIVDSKKRVYDFTWKAPHWLEFPQVKDSQKYTKLCFFTSSVSNENHSEEIIKRGGKFFWKTTDYNNKIIRDEEYLTTEREFEDDIIESVKKNGNWQDVPYGKTGCIFNGSIISYNNTYVSSDLTITPVLVDCDKINNKERAWACWADVAAYNNDINICKMHSDIDYCYNFFAKVNRDKEACKYIKRNGNVGEGIINKEDCIYTAR